MKVKECMCTKVACVTPGDSISNVAKVMQSNHIGCVPVCDQQQQLCGIITDRDIVLRVVACQKDINQTMASDIMTTQICTCKQDDEMTNAQSQMEINQIRRLPVCDNQNRVVGMLTLGNLANNNQQIGQQQVANTLGNICNCQGQAKNNQ
ncbi:MAG: CBS domain-containing protein [Clostridia bacterium]|nr:CBS domain-containing protein [Clostridia bacterium]